MVTLVGTSQYPRVLYSQELLTQYPQYPRYCTVPKPVLGTAQYIQYRSILRYCKLVLRYCTVPSMYCGTAAQMSTVGTAARYCAIPKKDRKSDTCFWKNPRE